MRVISGSARGTQLETLPGIDVTRPTVNRVKEAMFSSVQFLIQGANVLDLFAGSGQLGIEALSRGAKHCVFIDENSTAINIIKDNLNKTALFDKAEVLKYNAQEYLSKSKGKFDIVLLDPPYAQGVLCEILPLLTAVLNSGAVVLAEAKTGTNLQNRYGELLLKKSYKYGNVSVFKYEF